MLWPQRVKSLAPRPNGLLGVIQSQNDPPLIFGRCGAGVFTLLRTTKLFVNIV